MTPDLQAIEERRQACLDAVNLQQQPMGRAMAWASNGAPLIRTDIPALLSALRSSEEARERLERALRLYAEWMGPACTDDCSMDADTCDCEGKPVNDAVNAALAQAPR